jgi:hypothetical protein
LLCDGTTVCLSPNVTRICEPLPLFESNVAPLLFSQRKNSEVFTDQ